MGLTLKETGAAFELCPAGTYQARCYAIADLGSQAINFNGETKLMQKLVILWELSERMQDDRPFAISKFYTASLNEKANLRKDLESWRGRAFTPEELEGFSMAKVVGTNCLLNVIHSKDKQGRDRADISSIMALPKGMPSLEPVNDLVYLDFDDFDSNAYERLPQWIRTKIAASPEYQAMANQSVQPFQDIPEDLPY